jgi:tRNA-dihydrouridine synthase
MVGRGIFQNPWIFGPDADREHAPKERLALLTNHAQLWQKQWEGVKPFDLMKKFAKAYVSGWPGAAELRGKLMTCRNVDELREVVTGYR